MFEKLKGSEELKNIGLIVLSSDDERNKHIERKAEILLGFLGLIIPAVSGLFYYVYIGDQIHEHCITLFKYSFVVGIALLFLSAFFSILTLITRIFQHIDLKKIWEEEGKGEKISPLIQIKKDLTQHFYEIHIQNKKTIDNKALLLTVSFYLILASILLITSVICFLIFII